jgi:hypothetical protein
MDVKMIAAYAAQDAVKIASRVTENGAMTLRGESALAELTS